MCLEGSPGADFAVGGLVAVNGSPKVRFTVAVERVRLRRNTL
jgi:hypothetical protein